MKTEGVAKKVAMLELSGQLVASRAEMTYWSGDLQSSRVGSPSPEVGRGKETASPCAGDAFG